MEEPAVGSAASLAIPDSSISQAFGVSSDGQRLLFARARGSDRLGVVLNWTPSTDDRRQQS